MGTEMKDSGVEWIGKIPLNWAVKKLKYVASERTEQLLETTDPDYQFRYVEISSVSEAEGISKYEDMTFKIAPSRARKKVQIGDILISTVRTYLRAIAAVDDSDDVIVSTGFAVIRPVDINPCFLKYATLSESFISEIMANSEGISYPSTTSNKILSQKIALPSRFEQDKIAQYLDVECIRINHITSLLKEKIQKLKELKRSLISELVTKGLVPNVDLKDSGIEWIGKIPVDWKLSPLKNVFTVYAGSTPKSDISEYWDGDIVWVTPSDMDKSQKEIASSKKKITHKGYDSANLTIVPSGSLILSTRAPVGTINISTTPLCTNQGCKSLVVKNCKTDVRFYYYFLSILDAPLNALSLGTTFLELSTRALESFQVPVPKHSMQRAISNYLDIKCSRIDNLIDLETKFYEKLTEYKQSIIYEYVTGKKRVPQEV